MPLLFTKLLGSLLGPPGTGGGGGGSDLLWDTLTGPLAAGGSIYKRVNAYAGSCLRVRRASDNAEQDIGFSGGKIDRTALETFCTGTDGFVVTFYDQTGNAKHATIASSALQPKVVNSGTAITAGNGEVAIELDGTNDYLSCGTSIVNAPTAISLHAVSAPVSTISNGTNDEGIMALASSVSARIFLMYGSFFSSETHTATFSSGTVSNLDEAGTLPANAVDYFSQCLKANHHSAWRSGAVIGAVDNSTTMNPAALTTAAELRLGQRFGTSFTDNGAIRLQEWLVVTAHTEDNGDRAKLETQWGTDF